MAEYTKNYNLKKPGKEDFYNVEDMNDNLDTIDDELKNINEDKASKDYVDDAVGGIDIDVPVKSVNNKTGAVVIDKEDVGLGNVLNKEQLGKSETAKDSERLDGNSIEQVRAGVTKDDVGLGNVTNDKQATEVEFNELKREVSSHKADMAYQTPTVVGNQIQIQKQGNNNRLFFKLDSDLSGSITISLDGGATSLPVKDIYGNAVTSMSKGFVEVVFNTTFFILRPSGGGVKFASGSIRPYSYDSTMGYVSIVVSGLNFRPGSVLIFGDKNGVNAFDQICGYLKADYTSLGTEKSLDMRGSANNPTWTPKGDIGILQQYHMAYMSKNVVYPAQEGFVAYVRDNDTLRNYDWIAME